MIKKQNNNKAKNDMKKIVKFLKKATKKELVKIEKKAIFACANYLRSRNWSYLVGGFSGIEQGELKYNFRLIFKFTGKPPKNKKI